MKETAGFVPDLSSCRRENGVIMEKTDHLYVSPRRPTADWSLFMCSVAARSVD